MTMMMIGMMMRGRRRRDYKEDGLETIGED